MWVIFIIFGFLNIAIGVCSYIDSHEVRTKETQILRVSEQSGEIKTICAGQWDESKEWVQKRTAAL